TDATVSTASVKLFLDSAKSFSTTAADYALYTAGGKVWDSGATWSTAGAAGAWSWGAGDPGSTAYGTLSLTGTASSGYRAFAGLEPVVQGWVDGTIAKRGLVLKHAGNVSNNVLYFHSSSTVATNNGKRPSLTAN